MSKKALAARTLEDEIEDARLQICRAEAALQEVADRYFGYDHTTENGKRSIEYSFDRYSMFADIAYDYLSKTRGIIEDLSKLATKGKAIGCDKSLSGGGLI